MQLKKLLICPIWCRRAFQTEKYEGNCRFGVTKLFKIFFIGQYLACGMRAKFSCSPLLCFMSVSTGLFLSI